MIVLAKKVAKKLLFRPKTLAQQGPAEYWTTHMVANDEFQSAEESLSHFHWRNIQYPDYIQLMPVRGFDNKVVVDYGCGPGNDVVGFSVFSNVTKLYACDVSLTAMDRAKRRLSLHGKSAQFVPIDENSNAIDIPSSSVDHLHSSGVLHHCANLDAVMKELYRILRPGGTMNIMIYNKDSLWYHLYVAWMKRIVEGKYSELSMLDAFAKCTDGENCPIALCYSPAEFISLVECYGFKGKLTGVSFSNDEIQWMRNRFKAIRDSRLPKEHQDFLKELTFDERGFPLHNGNVAGINACFTFTK